MTTTCLMGVVVRWARVKCTAGSGFGAECADAAVAAAAPPPTAKATDTPITDALRKGKCMSRSLHSRWVDVGDEADPLRPKSLLGERIVSRPQIRQEYKRRDLQVHQTLALTVRPDPPRQATPHSRSASSKPSASGSAASSPGPAHAASSASSPARRPPPVTVAA